jgi:Spy/CpxP family protein refolding chaperone
MKSQMIIGVLLTMTIGSVSVVWANCDCRPCGPGWREGHRQGGREAGQANREQEERGFSRFAKALGLTEAQKAKIEVIVQADRDKSAPLLRNLEDSWKQLRQAELAAKFDEAAVRSIAASQAQLVMEMTVGHARTRSQIHALLTPEQRTCAAKLRPPMEDGGPGFFHPPMEERSHREMLHCGDE